LSSYLAFVFYLIYCLAFFLFLSGSLPGKFSEILCSRGPAGNTLVWRGSLRSTGCRSGPAGEHCDLDVAVVVVGVVGVVVGVVDGVVVVVLF
jgi:hypothetical protein